MQSLPEEFHEEIRRRAARESLPGVEKQKTNSHMWRMQQNDRNVQEESHQADYHTAVKCHGYSSFFGIDYVVNLYLTFYYCLFLFV